MDRLELVVRLGELVLKRAEAESEGIKPRWLLAFVLNPRRHVHHIHMCHLRRWGSRDKRTRALPTQRARQRTISRARRIRDVAVVIFVVMREHARTSASGVHAALGAGGGRRAVAVRLPVRSSATLHHDGPLAVLLPTCEQPAVGLVALAAAIVKESLAAVRLRLRIAHWTTSADRFLEQLLALCAELRLALPIPSLPALIPISVAVAACLVHCVGSVAPDGSKTRCERVRDGRWRLRGRRHRATGVGLLPRVPHRRQLARSRSDGVPASCRRLAAAQNRCQVVLDAVLGAIDA